MATISKARVSKGPREDKAHWAELTNVGWNIECAKRPRRDSELLLPESIRIGLYPVRIAPRINSRHKVPLSLWVQLAEQYRIRSLRQLAEEYGVSHESIRRTILNAETEHWRQNQQPCPPHPD